MSLGQPWLTEGRPVAQGSEYPQPNLSVPGQGSSLASGPVLVPASQLRPGSTLNTDLSAHVLGGCLQVGPAGSGLACAMEMLTVPCLCPPHLHHQQTGGGAVSLQLTGTSLTAGAMERPRPGFPTMCPPICLLTRQAPNQVRPQSQPFARTTTHLLT